MRNFPLFVTSFNEENTVYILREDGSEIRVNLGRMIPEQRTILNAEELKILQNINLEQWL